ncbi:MAG: hypothetical protein H7312_14305 [Tardiphaga sp.]|nr:hypothetical protein [Tardiphaga sp.]
MNERLAATSRGHDTLRRDVAIILSVWTAGILILVLGTVTNANIGFVWPMGQDIDWSLILKQGIGAYAAEQEFSIDHRNPLSGWVYSIASPLILGHIYGFHILRLLTCLFLGLSFYALARQLCRREASYFPVLLGSSIAMWWFWSNHTQVVWLMLFVLALSALIVWSYCIYVDSDRRWGAFYAFSLALWLVALGTYSIQCGAIISVFLIALFRGRSRGLGPAIRDTFPYLLIAVSFAAIWITSARGFFLEDAVSKTTQAHLSVAALFKSIGYFLWHPSFTRVLSSAIEHWSAMTFAAVFGCGILIAYLLKRLTFDETRFAAKSLREGSLWILIVAASLAVPTLFLEATSPIWKPGTRSEMMYAGFVPMAVLGVAALICSFLRRGAATKVLFATAAVLMSIVVLLNVEQNREATAVYRWQTNLAAGLQPLQRATPGALHFLVINSSGRSHIDPGFGARFAQDKLGRIPTRWSAVSLSSESSLRVIENLAAPTGYSGTWTVTIGPNTVYGAMENSHEEVPRETVRVVRFNGVTVEALASVSEADIAGLQARLVH